MDAQGAHIGDVTSGTQSPTPRQGHRPGLRANRAGRPRHAHFRAGARQELARHGEQAAAGAGHGGSLMSS
ncbi:MAG: hypothetical protein WKG07_39290 [Hymenobacter sp.]